MPEKIGSLIWGVRPAVRLVSARNGPPARLSWSELHRFPIPTRLSNLISRMMLSLPNEVILHIIHYVCPSDIEAVAFVCKRIAALAQNTLRRHFELKAKYSTIRFSGDLEYHLKEFQFIKDLCADSSIRYYPKELKLTWFPGPLLDREHANFSEEANDVLQSFIHDAPVFRDKSDLQRRDMIDHPDRSSPDVSIGVLFAVLPKLRSLIFSTDWDRWPPYENLMRRMIDYIAEANGKSSDLALQAHDGFPQLQEVTLKGEYEMTSVQSGSFNLFAHFSKMPSMRTLKGSIIGGKESDQRFGYIWTSLFPPGASAVTNINLTSSAVDGFVFEAFLAGTVALQKFTYHHAARGHLYEPRRIVEALRKHASGSLELLDLSADQEICAIDEHDQSVGSLATFTALKTIRADDKIFTLPWSDREGNEGKKRAMSRLGDVLPTSVETISLILCGDWEKVFYSLAEVKKLLSVQPKSVHLESSYSPDKEIKEALENLGVVISVHAASPHFSERR